MLATLKQSITFNSSPATDDNEQSPAINWSRLRNAIKKRLRDHWRLNHLPWQELDDAIQNACGFAFESVRRGVAPGLAVFRSVGRVKRGQTFVYEPANRSERSWEERADFSRSLNGVGAATRRASAGLPLSGRSSLD